MLVGHNSASLLAMLVFLPVLFILYIKLLKKYSFIQIKDKLELVLREHYMKSLRLIAQKKQNKIKTHYITVLPSLNALQVNLK